jgi:adenosylmethionine-8-amino-7-oxononanoate aminotransferase
MLNKGQVIKPDLREQYICWDHGEGCYLLDKHGARYLDAAAGVGVMALGYGVADFGRALHEQSDRLPYVHGMRFTSAAAQELAELVRHWAGPRFEWSFFCCGGSEAVDSALKIARQHFLEKGLPAKSRFVGRWQSFHGNTLGAQAVGGHIARRKAQLPLLMMWPHIVPPTCYRCPFGLSLETCGTACAYDLERTIRSEGAESIAAFIAEPIVGAAGGAPVPPPEYFPIVREICDRYDVLFIADEVITGWGRTGRRFGIEHWGVVPDLIVTAKAISAGYAPLGAVLVHDRVMQAFLAGSSRIEHNFTYAANPMSCRAGVVALTLMDQAGVVENAAARGVQLMKRLEACRDFPFVGDVRGKGLLVGIEFVANRSSKAPFPPEVRLHQWANRIALDNRLIVYPGGGTADGILGDHILLMPPLVIGEQDVDILADRLLTTFERLGKELRAAGVAFG